MFKVGVIPMNLQMVLEKLRSMGAKSIAHETINTTVTVTFALSGLHFNPKGFIQKQIGHNIVGGLVEEC